MYIKEINQRTDKLKHDVAIFKIEGPTGRQRIAKNILLPSFRKKLVDVTSPEEEKWPSNLLLVDIYNRQVPVVNMTLHLNKLEFLHAKFGIKWLVIF